MSVWSWLTAPFTKSDPRYASFVMMQGTSEPVQMAQKYATYAKEGYRRNQTLYKCISYIARNAAEVSWKLYADETKKREITSHPLLEKWKRPNVAQSRYQFVQDWISCLELGGNAFIQAATVFKGTPPDELYVLRPDFVRVAVDDNGIKAYQYGSGGGKQVPLDAKQVAHSKFWNPDDAIRGMSPLEVAAIKVDIQTAADKWNLALMQNNARPPGAWMTERTLVKQDFDKLREQLDLKYAGVKNAGKPLLMDGGLKWQQMGLAPAQLDWLAGYIQQSVSIASIYCIPPQLIEDTGATTYNNMKEAKYASYTEAIFPALDMLQGELNTWWVPMYGKGLFLVYDKESVETVQELLQAQKTARNDQASKVYLSGGCTLNEYRDMIELPSVPQGDVFRVKDILVPAAKLEEYAEQAMKTPVAPSLPVPENELNMPTQPLQGAPQKGLLYAVPSPYQEDTSEASASAVVQLSDVQVAELNRGRASARMPQEMVTFLERYGA